MSTSDINAALLHLKKKKKTFINKCSFQTFS